LRVPRDSKACTRRSPLDQAEAMIPRGRSRSSDKYPRIRSMSSSSPISTLLASPRGIEAPFAERERANAAQDAASPRCGMRFPSRRFSYTSRDAGLLLRGSNHDSQHRTPRTPRVATGGAPPTHCCSTPSRPPANLTCAQCRPGDIHTSDKRSYRLLLLTHMQNLGNAAESRWNLSAR